MSSGAFTLVRYAASYSAVEQIHPIKVQPETTGLTIGGIVNIPPINATTNKLSAKVSGSKRSLGLTARSVSFKFTGATPQAGLYKADATIRLPWLNPFTSEISKGATGTYLGEPIIVVGTSPEYAN